MQQVLRLLQEPLSPLKHVELDHSLLNGELPQIITASTALQASTVLPLRSQNQAQFALQDLLVRADLPELPLLHVLQLEHSAHKEVLWPFTAQRDSRAHSSSHIAFLALLVTSACGV